MNTGLVPTNCTLYDEASFVIRPSASAPRVSASCRRAASRSISNGHSYGYERTSMRSWRSAAAQSPGSDRSPSTRSVPTMSPRAMASLEEAGRGECLVVGEAPPWTGRATRRRRRRTPATAGRGTNRGRLDAPQLSASEPTSSACASSAFVRCFLENTPSTRWPYILQEHTETGDAAGEGGGDHAPGAGIEIAEHWRTIARRSASRRSSATHRPPPVHPFCPVGTGPIGPVSKDESRQEAAWMACQTRSGGGRHVDVADPEVGQRHRRRPTARPASSRSCPTRRCPWRRAG